MVRRYLFIVSALLASVLLLAVHSAHAQIGTGTLTGKVVDASNNKPLVDVVVTATSPALQGEQTVVTDGSGSFRIPSLPPGDYVITYEGDGFRPYQRSGIALRTGTNLRVDAQLLPENLSADEVTVVAAPPTVDVGSARTGVTIGSEFRNRVPVAPPGGKGGAARSFEQLAEIAPTGRNDTYGASISGTTSVENVYMIDGLASGDPGKGYNASPLSVDFIKETNIITGGYLPEYGRGGGGVLDVTTQSGSNEFRGSVFGYLTPWQGNPKFAPPQDAITTTTQQDAVRDIGFSLGGPIIKDKLWFFVGADLSRQSFNLNRRVSALTTDPTTGKWVRDSNGFITSTPIEGMRRTYLAEQTGYQYLGKLTWSPGPNDRIELNHRGTPTRSGGDGKYSVDYETGRPLIFGSTGGNLAGRYETAAWRQVFDSYDTGIKWSHSAFNKRLTVDTLFGWHRQRSADLASDGTIGGPGLSGIPQFTFAQSSPASHSLTEFETLPNPSVCTNPVSGGDPRCPVSAYSFGGPSILQDNRADRFQLREIATFVTPGLGHHVIKAGAEVEFTKISNKRGYPGGTPFNESASGRNVNNIRRYGGLTGPDESYTLDQLNYKVSTVSVGAFLQDSWSIMDKVTLNAGFRYDTQTLFADQGRGLVLPNQWSPRVGAIFDPTQRGYSKIFVNYAIYYQSLPLNVMSRAGSGEPQVRATRPRTACNPLSSPNYPQGCDDPAVLGVATSNGSADPNQKWAYISTGRLAVDPDLKPQSTNELSAGGEYEVLRNGRLSFTYIRRWMRTIVEDMSRDEGSTFFLGNPSSGIASDFPEAERTFDAGIFAFTKTFAENWLAQVSYTVSSLRGNWEGLFRSQTGQLDPGTTSDFDLRDLTVNRKGFLAGDRRHELKVFAAYDIPFSLKHHVNVGAAYQMRSGAPQNTLGRHVLYGADEVFLLPRGSYDRLPWLHNVDLNVSYTFLKNEKQTLAVTGDVFNLLNFRKVIRRGNRYTNRPVSPIQGDAAKNPYVNGNKRDIDPALIQPTDGEERPFEETDKTRTFGAPLEYQAPITLRVGLKSTF